MRKINEALRSILVFDRREIAANNDRDLPGTQVIISTNYDGIYIQYSYINLDTNIKSLQQDTTVLEKEVKDFLTHKIDVELSKKYVRCKSCWQYIKHPFEKSTMYKCGNCGEVNEIKVLIEK